MHHQLIASIASYGDKYRQEYLTEFKPDHLAANWWTALDFFFGRACYQGRRDDVSALVQKEVTTVLEPRFKNQDASKGFEIERTQKWDAIKTELEGHIGKGKVGKARDVEMIVSTLDFIAGLPDLNIVKHSKERIERGQIDAHYGELQRIVQVGPKVASFYLRDVVTLYGLEQSVPARFAVQLQPIDVWVQRLVHKIGLVEPNASDTAIREAIVVECVQHGISPIQFNQGAWYIGSHAFDLMLDHLSSQSLA